MRAFTAILAVAVVTCSVRGAGQGSLRRVHVTAPDRAHAVLHVTTRETAGVMQPPACALVVRVDGGGDQQILLTPGVERTSYSALVGPLTPGAHDITIEPSTLWPSCAALDVTTATADMVPATDPRAAVLAHAPILGLRSDTVGTPNDLPLLMYAEDERTNGEGLIRYSVIFSNEDGGTATRPLMARWGRATDIEMVYEVEVRRDGQARGRIQGPDHKVLPLAGRTVGSHPILVVVTMNNMVLDRGASVATVRLVPDLVSLVDATRESVMDRHPWTYRVMARELEREGKIGGAGIEDPRAFVYVELDLALEQAAVAVGVRTETGITAWSDRGEPELAVARNGDVRIAVPWPAGTGAPGAVAVRCDPRVDRAAPVAPRCNVRVTRAFVLDDLYRPRPNLVRSVELQLTPGRQRDVPLTPSRTPER